MMRVCPKCGDFYADGSLPFCLADGTPLAGVAPDSEVWSKGVRVVEEKASTLRRHGRTQKWRRVLFSVTTTLVITTVVCVVALNSLIYLRPMPEERIPTEPLALAPPPTGPGDSTFPITEPTPAPTPQPTASPSPSALPTAAEETTPPTDVKPTASPTVTASPRTSPTISSTTSPTTPPTTSLTTSPTISPATSPVTSPTTTFSTVPPRTPTPDVRQTPTPDVRHTPTPDLPRTPTPTPTPRPVCSDADRRREGEALVRNFGAAWRRRIEGDRRKVIARYVADPRGAQNVEASLGTVEFTPTFLEQCRVSIVSARYSWQVRTGATPTAPAKVGSVPGAKQFSCFRLGGGWLCP